MPRRLRHDRAVIRRPAARRGFTLLETALALVIVMTGVLAIMEAQTAFIRSNMWSSHEATATYLANEIRERMRVLPRHDPVIGLRLIGGVATPGYETGEITVADLDDVDDYHLVEFGTGGTFPGPIDAFGVVIPQIDPDGVVVMSGGVAQALQGWTQRVEVEKVDPYHVANVRDWSDVDLPAGNFPGRAVDEFPLRVTVTIFYQGPYDAQRAQVIEMSWIQF
jgi:type II secretory pathway pseudopilin PulG